MKAELIRVRGLVQGVGFRPTVWRLAQDFALVGDVRNDGEGVLIRVQPAVGAGSDPIDRFCATLRRDCPPLARIDSVERSPLPEPLDTEVFSILASDASDVRTGIVPDAATCDACAAEIGDPGDRRHRYAFTNCTHCGPRLSIVRGIPYDRTRTSMSVFPMCPSCQAEYQDPSDRRFHAQPNACPDCGPRVWLVGRDGREADLAQLGPGDAISVASRLLADGRILAVKGIGGFHLACDATRADSVAELRRRKRRFAKPFALMARDLEVVRDYCHVTEQEADLLAGPAAPIVLLEPHPASPSPERPPLAPDAAPGQTALGFMLPYSPIHHLLLAGWDRPLVMTSGNLSEEPQCIDNEDAARRLAPLADFVLLHDREIVNRVDDSVVRTTAGSPRLLRRARGFAPAPIALPPGFDGAPPILALGGELKSTFCLLRDGQAILSQHLGDLEDALTARELERTLELYLDLFQLEPSRIAVDLHPSYRSTIIGRGRAGRTGAELEGVQHHHAHLASTLADNGWPLDAGPVLGILLDGLGFGPDGTLWGGEILAGDYRDYRRVGHLEPAVMPGGTRAILEPWRNLYARLAAARGWEHWRKHYSGLDPIRRLSSQPLGVVQTMMDRGVNSPWSSSMGRLFDAVASALGLGGERISYEGQAAIELESCAAQAIGTERRGYDFEIQDGSEGAVLSPTPLWGMILDDLEASVPRPVIAARFHLGLAHSTVEWGSTLARRHGLTTVALSGGVFQNKILLEAVQKGLTDRGFTVLLQRQVPSNDGGLSLGQACIAAARAIG